MLNSYSRMFATPTANITSDRRIHDERPLVPLRERFRALWSHYASADTWFCLWVCIHHLMASPRGAVGAVSCGDSWPHGRGAGEFGLVGPGACRAARACGPSDCALLSSLFGTPAQTFQQARAPV